MAGELSSHGERLGRVQSLVRAFSILDELRRVDGLTLSEISALVDLPRSTAHRLLTTMEALEYVQFNRKTNHWLVGLSAFKLGAAFADTRDLSQLGRKIMQTLVMEVNHNVNFSITENHAMLYLSQVEAKGAWLTAARPGVTLPMYATAAGKALLACWSEKQLDQFLDKCELVQRTDRTISNRDSLRRELRQIRERGYATDDEENLDGQRCVAAALTDRIGQPRGSISVSDSSMRLHRNRLDVLGPIIVASARRLSNEVTVYAA